MADKRREAARLIVETLPSLMQALAAEMRGREVSMPMSHFRTLHLLAIHSFTPSELARKQRVSLPTVSNTIDVLENAGWVERVADPDDRRKSMLRLTDAGMHAHEQMLESVTELLSGFFKDLSHEELDMMLDGLGVLRRVATTQAADAAGKTAGAES